MKRYKQLLLSALTLTALTFMSTPAAAGGRRDAQTDRGRRAPAAAPRANRPSPRAQPAPRAARPAPRAARPAPRAARPAPHRAERPYARPAPSRAATRNAHDRRAAADRRAVVADRRAAAHHRRVAADRRAAADYRAWRHDQNRRAHWRYANRSHYRTVHYAPRRPYARWVHDGYWFDTMPYGARRVHHRGHWYYLLDGMYFDLLDGVWVQISFH